VDITLKVSAAAVYSEFRVAAGWGVAAVNGPQARITPRASVNNRKYLYRDAGIRTSDLKIAIDKDVRWEYGVPIKKPKFWLRLFLSSRLLF
jgi:hypothetical protein